MHEESFEVILVYCWVQHLVNVETLAVSLPDDEMAGTMTYGAKLDIAPSLQKPLPKLREIILSNFVVPQTLIALHKLSLQTIHLESCALSCDRKNIDVFEPDDGYWEDFFETLMENRPSALMSFELCPQHVLRYVSLEAEDKKLPI